MVDNRLLTDDELTNELQALPGWSASEGKLHRSFELGSFRKAMAFMVEVSYEAEALQHHPNWSNVYGTVQIALWSHDLGGVSASCTKLARAMNRAAPKS
jgi:4a-hydroxytetrahydrobiopterin dehydratase